jgi:hypothetical protein
MTADQLREIVTRKPFRPVAVTAVAGDSYQLEEETDVLHSPRRPELFIFFTEQRMHIVEADEIASATVL